MGKTFEKYSFKNRLTSMIKVDMRRMFTTPLFYIILGICLVVPVLIFVMTSMMEGSVSVNPTTGEETVMEGFKNVWESLGALPGSESAAAMSLVSMCNINLVYFGVAVLVCLFVSDDFKSGYAKNLFTVRSDKKDYVISKTFVCFICGVLLLISYLIGSIIGGGIASLSFETVGFSTGNIVLCVLAKIFILLVFTPIFLVMSVVGKQRTWLCIVLAFGVSMLLYMMIPSISPLNSTIINVVLCIAGGALFSFGIGSISTLVLKKSSLV